MSARCRALATVLHRKRTRIGVAGTRKLRLSPMARTRLNNVLAQVRSWTMPQLGAHGGIDGGVTRVRASGLFGHGVVHRFAAAENVHVGLESLRHSRVSQRKARRTA